MSFWDRIKERVSAPFKGARAAIGIAPMSAAASFTAAKAAQAGAPSNIASRIGQKQLVDVSKPTNVVLEQLVTPYRELVAEPLVASSFEEDTSDSWLALGKEFVEGLPGDFGIEESKGAQYVSPGQAFVREIGRAIPTVQAVDKVDFTNPEDVQNFFSKGAPKFWSGTADFGFTLGLDPLLLAGTGTQVAKYSLLRRTVKDENDALRVAADIDEAVINNPSSWRPIIDEIMSDNIQSPADILTLGILSESTKPSDIAVSLFDAKKVGREAVGDILKVATGDVKSLQKVTTQFQSARKAFQEAEQITDSIKLELEKPIIGGDLTITSRAEGQRLLREANENLQKAALEDERLSRIVRGDFETGTEFDGIWGTLRGKSMSKFEFLERAKVKNAGKASDSYWNVHEFKSPNGQVSRIASWLNRGNLQKETPSTYVVLNESGSQNAYREVAALAREVQKQANLSPEWSKQQLSQWTRLTTKKERREFLQEFEDEGLYLLIKKLIPNAKKLNNTELQFIKILAKTLAGNYRQAKYRALSETLENGYHVLDGSNNPIFLQDFDKFLKTFGETKESYSRQIAKELEGAPLLETDVPGIYQVLDFEVFKDIIEQNPERFNYIIDLIKSSGLDESGLRKQINQINKEAQTKRIESNVQSFSKTFKTEAILMADTFSTFWKPTILLGIRYALRNAFAGSLRVPAAITELSYELGYKKSSLYREMLPSVKTAAYTVNNIKKIKRTRTGKKEFDRRSFTYERELLLRESSIRQENRQLNNLIREVRAKQKNLRIVKSTRLKDISELLSMSVKKFPVEKQKELDNLMNKFIDESISDDEFIKVTDLFTAKLLNDKEIKDFANLFAFFNKALNNNLNEVEKILASGVKGAKGKAAAKARNIGSYPITPFEIGLLNDMRLIYKDIIGNTERTATLLGERGILLDEFQALAAGKTPKYQRVGTDTFEAFKGTFVSDYFAGKIGEFARLNISAGKTLRTTIGQANRQSIISMYGRKNSSIVVEPDNPMWAEQWANFVNTRLYNDELMQRIAKGESDADIIKYLKNAESKQYRKNVEVAIKEWGQDNIGQFVKAVRLMGEKYMPPVDGLDLRAAVMNGNLTPEQALRIPEDVRSGIYGFELYPGKETSISGWYQRGIKAFFKYFGSLPEDVLLRNPLYRSSYRNEIRLLGKLAQKQGTELTDDVLKSIARQAHFRANKTVTEYLYTVERFSDPATFLRNVSPFFMAQQNDSKFWLGTAIKNPRIPYLGLMAWNSVNKSMEVRDTDEYQRRAGNNTVPINSGEQIWLTMPEGVAKFLGIPNMNILKISKDSINVILQGAIPLIPALGVLVQVPASIATKYLVGKDFDIDKELNSFGDFGTAVKEFALGPQAKGVEGLLPITGWTQNTIDFIFPEQSPRYHQRANLILEQKLLKLQEEDGVPITTSILAKTSQEAYREARRTFLAGIFFSFNSPFATQLGSEFELLKSEFRIYTSPVEQGGYGYEEGAIKFEQDYGPLKTSYARTSLSYNPAGLLSTNDTIKNIYKYKELFEDVFLTDKSVAGWLVNSGTRDDFSPLAHEKLGTIKVGSSKLRGKKDDILELEKERQVQQGWDIYLDEVEKIEVEYKDAPLELINGIKRIVKENVGKEYPIFLEQGNQDIDLDIKPRVSAINKVLNDDKFINSKQAETPLWQGLRAWAEEREKLSDALTKEGKQQADKLTKEIYLITARNIALDYPEFGPVFERYLSNDKLNKVQVRLK
jgi:hypothetical protein